VLARSKKSYSPEFREEAVKLVIETSRPTLNYTLRNYDSGKCLDVTEASTADHVNIDQYQCNGNKAQQFPLLNSAPGVCPMTRAVI
jgi:hypothetical protein